MKGAILKSDHVLYTLNNFDFFWSFAALSAKITSDCSNQLPIFNPANLSYYKGDIKFLKEFISYYNNFNQNFLGKEREDTNGRIIVNAIAFHIYCKDTGKIAITHLDKFKKFRTRDKKKWTRRAYKSNLYLLRHKYQNNEEYQALSKGLKKSFAFITSFTLSRVTKKQVNKIDAHSLTPNDLEIYNKYISGSLKPSSINQIRELVFNYKHLK